MNLRFENKQLSLSSLIKYRCQYQLIIAVFCVFLGVYPFSDVRKNLPKGGLKLLRGRPNVLLLIFKQIKKKVLHLMEGMAQCPSIRVL